jgi:DNA polymerase-3 subunit alpha
MDVPVRPPDVNRSDVTFTVQDREIFYGLLAIRNVGEAPARAIVEEREANGAFKDIYDFCERIDSKQINRRTVESLARAGAFESTGWSRAQVCAALDSALGEAQASQREKAAGQASLFDLLGEDDASVARHKPDVPEWSEHDLLQAEKEMLGLYVSRHPLKKWESVLRHYATPDLTDLPRDEGRTVAVGGLLSQVKHHVTAKGKKMAFVTVDTIEGPVEATVFSDVFERCETLLQRDAIVILPAHINLRNGEPGLIADDVIPIEEAQARLTKAVHIRMNTIGLDEARVDELAQVLGKHSGPCDVYLHCAMPDAREVTVHATAACMVSPTGELVRQIEQLFGEDALWFSGENGLPKHRI